MKTSSKLEFTYFIEDLVGEGSHTEFFMDWLGEVLGKSNGCTLLETIQYELEQGFKNSTLGELDCTGCGAYGDINFTFLLSQAQEDNLPSFKKSLDIWMEHIVTKYRLRRLFKFYQRVSIDAYRDRSEWFDVSTPDYRRMNNIVSYLARREMRKIPAWEPLLYSATHNT